MGPSRFLIDPLASRLDIRDRQIQGRWIFMLILVANFCVSAAGNDGINKLSWPDITFNDQIENLIVDEKDGSIFIVVDNNIYRYNKDLKLLSSTISSTSSKTTSNETDSSLLVNKILLVVRIGSNSDLLFSCWQAKDLTIKCLFNKVNELKSGLTLENKGFRIAASDQIKAISAPGDANAIFIATSKTIPSEESPATPYLPALGRFKVTKQNKHLNLEKESVLPYRDRIGDLLLFYEYVYLFAYNQHTHFLLNDIRKPLDSSSLSQENTVRLARICNEDVDLTSYTEISLSCNNENNLFAKYSYFNFDENDPKLYVVFEANHDSGHRTRRPNDRSVICSYSMKLINDLFYKAILDCNSGHQNSFLLLKCHHDQEQSPMCQKNPSTDWCSSKANPYIDGSSSSYMVKEDYSLILTGLTSVNFLHTVKQGLDPKEVFFIGTTYGSLTKINADEDLLYTVDLERKEVKNYELGEKSIVQAQVNEVQESKSSYYSVSSNYIMATSNSSSLNKLDMYSCNYYTSCRACLGARDPIECVWCGRSCSTKDACDSTQQSTSTCPPVIRSFYPHNGPITGRTQLKIEGENFGSTKGTLKAQINGLDCPVVQSSWTTDQFECIVPPVANPVNATLQVDVVDERDHFIPSKGSTTSDGFYSYVEVKVFGLYPSFGYYSVESDVSIFGENLNAGSNRTVTLGDFICDIKKSQSDRIICGVKALPMISSNYSSAPPTYDLKFYVDGSKQPLEYKSIFAGKNLSRGFVFSNEPSEAINQSTFPTIDGIHIVEQGSYITVLFLLIVFICFIAVVYYFCNQRISKLLKIKLPLKSNSSKLEEAQVSFQNPESHRFSNETGSVSGLVKLNGSIMTSDYFAKPEIHEQNQPLMHGSLDNEMLLILSQEKILIDRNRLTLGHVLGSGQFGRVYKGFLKVEQTGEHTAVAVKTLHNRSTWDDALDNRAFLEEGLMMKDFEHENVLALIGVTFDSSGLPMVVTPFMLYGDLRSYISDEASSPTVKELIDFATQVARGMAYLSNLKFVHRDLAARNCMLDENLSVKIADFGLSRDIYERDYYSSDNKKTKLPVKWMAIESLEKCIYNTKTDVWSYGVLLWELMTRGVVPYPDVDNFDLFSYLKEGRRMLRPRYCPLILYKIMLSCWNENPTHRPTFDELVVKVSDVITQLKIAKDGQQKVSRDITYCDLPNK